MTGAGQRSVPELPPRASNTVRLIYEYGPHRRFVDVPESIGNDFKLACHLLEEWTSDGARRSELPTYGGD
jgi:hypothetical protein